MATGRTIAPGRSVDAMKHDGQDTPPPSPSATPDARLRLIVMRVVRVVV